MVVLGIYGSPRKGGNSDLLLDKALEGAAQAGATIKKVYARKLKINGCLECGGCDKTGECVQRDDMDQVYPLLDEADAIILSAPMFFYAAPAQVKALVDRSQARWSGRMLRKKGEDRKRYDSGKGYLIGVGATRGKTLFDGYEMMGKYFYDALDMSYEGGAFFRKVEGKADVNDMPDALAKALELGKRAAAGEPMREDD